MGFYRLYSLNENENDCRKNGIESGKKYETEIENDFDPLRLFMKNSVFAIFYRGNLLSLYLSVKRSHHVRREGLEIPTLIQKREEYTP
jgi:hypothetical protein